MSNPISEIRAIEARFSRLGVDATWVEVGFALDIDHPSGKDILDIREAQLFLESLEARSDPGHSDFGGAEGPKRTLLKELQTVDMEVFGSLSPKSLFEDPFRPVMHLQQYLDILSVRQEEVVREYARVAPAIVAMHDNDIWLAIEELSPAADHDQTPSVRAAAKLIVTAMISEAMNRDPLKWRQWRKRLKRARQEYTRRFGKASIRIDWGLVIKRMAGAEAEDVPPVDPYA